MCPIQSNSSFELNITVFSYPQAGVVTGMGEVCVYNSVIMKIECPTNGLIAENCEWNK